MFYNIFDLKPNAGTRELASFRATTFYVICSAIIHIFFRFAAQCYFSLVHKQMSGEKRDAQRMRFRVLTIEAKTKQFLPLLPTPVLRLERTIATMDVFNFENNQFLLSGRWRKLITIQCRK